LVNHSRRDFLKATALATGALILGFRLDGESEAAEEAVFNPNAWLEITPANEVIIHVPWSELGQGPLTAVPMLLADELEVDFADVRVVKAWNDPRFGNMGTGGSRSVRTSWDPVRRAGAAARLMLVAAAAAQWGVAPGACRAEAGAVHHGGSSLTYGELATAAAGLDVPGDPPLKPREKRTLIGKNPPRKDIPAKVDGTADFGIDQRLEGMVYAAVAMPPTCGGRVEDFDPAPALAVPGVRGVHEIDGAVAVVADHTWAAFRGRDALKVTWADGPEPDLDNASIGKLFAAKKAEDAVVMGSEGDVAGALAAADTVVESTYELPYLCHAPMEPMNCTVRLSADLCEVWVPIQSVTWGANVAAAAAGLPVEKVRIQPTYAGGGFGRRLMVGYVGQAVEIAKACGKPVQLVWTREDDMRQGLYRPASHHRLKAGLDAEGHVTAWSHHLVAPSIGGQLNPTGYEEGRDESAVDGIVNLPYGIPNRDTLYSMTNTPVPTCWLRSVYNTQNALANECFVDEIARAAQVDPVELRLDLLPADSRLRGTLERAKKEWGWPAKKVEGRGHGVACHSCFGSHVTTMAEVSAEDGIRAHRVLVVVDCGPVVHPDGMVNQIEGAVGFALSHLFFEEVELRDGGVASSNFDDYPILTCNQMPQVRVVAIDSEEAIGGIGEPGYPPLGPAVLNALFDATGTRVKKLPLAPTYGIQG
jgi:isoquinoline 1-oxidoreductase beta subunit